MQTLDNSACRFVGVKGIVSCFSQNILWLFKFYVNFPLFEWEGPLMSIDNYLDGEFLLIEEIYKPMNN